MYKAFIALICGSLCSVTCNYYHISTEVDHFGATKVIYNYFVGRLVAELGAQKVVIV